MVSGTAVYNAKGNRYDWLTQTLHASIFTTECNSGPINPCVHSSLAFKSAWWNIFIVENKISRFSYPPFLWIFLTRYWATANIVYCRLEMIWLNWRPWSHHKRLAMEIWSGVLAFKNELGQELRIFFYQFCNSAAILMPFCFLIQHCFNSLKHFNIPVLKCCRPGHCFDWLRFVKSHG